MRKLSLIVIICALAAGCAGDKYPVPTSTLTVTYRVNAGSASAPMPLEKLDMYLRDGYQRLTGPIAIDVSNPQGPDENGVYTIENTLSVPYGIYEVWAWGNVPHDSLYTEDRYSLRMRNDVAAANYLLSRSDTVGFDKLHVYYTFELDSLTNRVEVSVDNSITDVRSITFYNMCTQVDAGKVYTLAAEGLDTVRFDKAGNNPMPPATIFLFPTIPGSTEPAVSRVEVVYNNGTENDTIRNYFTFFPGSATQHLTITPPIP